MVTHTQHPPFAETHYRASADGLSASNGVSAKTQISNPMSSFLIPVISIDEAITTLVLA